MRKTLTDLSPSPSKSELQQSAAVAADELVEDRYKEYAQASSNGPVGSDASNLVAAVEKAVLKLNRMKKEEKVGKHNQQISSGLAIAATRKGSACSAGSIGVSVRTAVVNSHMAPQSLVRGVKQHQVSSLSMQMASTSMSTGLGIDRVRRRDQAPFISNPR